MGGGGKSGGAGGQTAGAAGKPGGAGGQAAGSGGTSGGAGGTAGGGGKATAGGGQSQGGAGSAGKAAGGAGQSQAGGGQAGTGGTTGTTSCVTAQDCKDALPPTVPASCAEWTCDPTAKQCRLQTKDLDGDGHRSNKCVANTGVSVVLGDDCDDADKKTFPGAWDGPAGDGKPTACDSVDQDCSGTPDDASLPSGATCTCAPDDVQPCASDSSGKPITFPLLDGLGKPLGKCKLGARTCSKEGKWSACTGAVPPEPFEICNGGIDDDCDGKADMADSVLPTNTVDWTYDGDSDGYADAKAPLRARACQDLPPTSCATCDPTKWRLGYFAAKDCDDTNPDAYPGAKEWCNGADDDCNGTIDDSHAVDAKLWYYDYDGDQHGDIDIPAKKSCDRPTTIPAECVTATTTGLPADYCAGLPAEGGPPVCPPPPCTAAMWTDLAISNNDCKDHPGQGGAGKGNKPGAVRPGGTDFCNGFDYDCDGSANTGCGCSPVNSTQACGSESKCNEGTQTCVTGGTWGACSGGQEKSRVDYCPDDDSDGFCQLSACVADLCPGAFPDAIHKWKERTQCIGFTQPTGSDCDDTDGLINPGLLSEVCNGDGKDHNCNGKTNLVGAGDCACVAGTDRPCAPLGALYPVGKTPGDPLSGVCSWGSQSCVLGSWGLCTGGTGAQGAEVCNGDGLDYDCNGKTNIVGQGDCGCNGSQTESCGPCGKGNRTCSSGQWGSCIGDEATSLYCTDVDQDGHCAGNCGQVKCPSADLTGLRLETQCTGGKTNVDCDDLLGGVHSGATEICDGVDNNCAAGIDEGFPVGAACDNGLLGSCYKAGIQQCNASGAAACDAGTWSDAPAGSGSSELHGSFDRNCDGTLEYTSSCGSTCPVSTARLPSGFSCSTSGNNWQPHCTQFTSTPGVIKYRYFSCDRDNLEPTDLAPSYLTFTEGSFTRVPECGSTIIKVGCLCNSGDSSSCTYFQPTSLKQTCR
ncbi:MAG: putative metal-binding motif-containing protein [Polyangiaceae bacterium]|nr:putative metal-binding motif-containing protein [Polyangiaceae bacterium]